MSHFTIKQLLDRHRTVWSNKYFFISTLVGFLVLIASLFTNYASINYATRETVNVVASADILLDNLPVVNTDIIFSEGALIFVVIIIVLLLLEPEKIPFTLKSIALFVFIRSSFVVMTHLGRIPNGIVTDLDNLKYISSGSDLFFSGHTGLPFLMSLLFWDNKFLRILFIVSSITAAIAVILGHLHYTIDVFSAFFIAYGVYNLSLRFFKRDYNFFVSH